MEHTLTTDKFDPVSIHLGRPSLPTHKAAYTTVTELYEESIFPTGDVIREKWYQRLTEALHFQGQEYSPHSAQNQNSDRQ